MPDKGQAVQEEGKKKVKYVSRQRKNKKKEESEEGSVTSQVDAVEDSGAVKAPEEEVGGERVGAI